MKRTIGYKPTESTNKPKRDTHPLASIAQLGKEAAQPVNVLELISEELVKVDKIVKWINVHPEFKWGVMCDKIGIDKGNFHRTLKSNTPKIKIEFIPQIETFLTNYGYAK